MANIKFSELSSALAVTGGDAFPLVTDGENPVTLKAPASIIKEYMNTDTPVLVLTASSVTELPRTINNANITADMVVVNSYLSNPAAQTGEWTVTPSAGSLSITGSMSGTTNITLYLAHSR